jgi:hypothetical protein
MTFKQLAVAAPSVLVVFASGVANAGQTIDLAGAMTCVVDKWDESEPEKGHKLANYAGRCVIIPDASNASKYAEECVGNYEYMPDGSWKGAGTCTADFKGGDEIFLTWNEGSQLAEFSYEFTGGTGKYEGAKGGGTYKVDELTSTLYGGRKKGTLELP